MISLLLKDDRSDLVLLPVGEGRCGFDPLTPSPWP